MAYDIERYLNIRGAGGPTVGPSGELAFMLDTTGSNQVWQLDEPEAWPEQLTFHDERVVYASFSPTREELVYGMDEGGDEFVQLHRLSADGSEDVALTDAPDAKHNWGGWSHDGDRFAYAANRRDQAVFDVYVQDRDETGEDAELVLEGDQFSRISAAGGAPATTDCCSTRVTRTSATTSTSSTSTAARSHTPRRSRPTRASPRWRGRPTATASTSRPTTTPTCDTWACSTPRQGRSSASSTAATGR